MTRSAKHVVAFLVVGTLAGCGREGTPTSPSGPTSFLTGTWRGTVTIQVNPGDPNPPPPSSGDMTWTFEVVPQTNMQSFRTTIRSENGWLPITLTSSTSMIPGNTPPAQISTQGEYNSPRGCRGTFGSFATAEARSIQGSITGVDCPVPFTGSVTLTKE